MSTTRTIPLRPAGRHRAPTPRLVQWFGEAGRIRPRDAAEDVLLALHDRIASPLTGVVAAVVGVAAVLWTLR